MAQHSEKSPAELIARLAAARETLGAEAQVVRKALDVPARVRKSVYLKPIGWLGGSTIAGLLVSFLIPKRSSDARPKKKRGFLGFVLGTVFSLARPTLQKWALTYLRNRLIPAGRLPGPHVAGRAGFLETDH